MKYCSHCGKELKDLKINIALDIKGYRRKPDGEFEEIPNTFLTPKEVLCKECFDEFVNVIDLVFNQNGDVSVSV